MADRKWKDSFSFIGGETVQEMYIVCCCSIILMQGWKYMLSHQVELSN